MILVTGATGHIGNVLVRQLVNNGYRVRAMVLPGEDVTPISDVNVEIVTGDVTRPETLEPAFADVEGVFHLAGIISILPGDNPIVDKVNVQGTKNMLDLAIKYHVKRFLYTSSIHAIKRIPVGTVIDENVPFDPQATVASYDRSKSRASLAVLEAVEKGLDAVIVCPTGVIGPYDYRLSEMGSLLKDWIENPVNFIIDGEYDFVDVRDVVDGMVRAYEKGKSGHTYILSGQAIQVPQLLRLVKEILNVRPHPIKIPVKIALAFSRLTPFFCKLTHSRPRFTTYSIETLNTNSDISSAKAQRELGYHPRLLVNTIRDTVEWLLANARLFKKGAKA